MRSFFSRCQVLKGLAGREKLAAVLLHALAPDRRDRQVAELRRELVEVPGVVAPAALAQARPTPRLP
jgi:hypothetical protein